LRLGKTLTKKENKIMNTEQIKEINTHLALIEAEMGRIRVMVREAMAESAESRPSAPVLNQSEPDYSHWLPQGYEFCAEEVAEKWIKVKNPAEANPLGHIWQLDKRPFLAVIGEYRPIRKIQAPPDPKQDLFNLLSEEFGVVALESDMREIIDAVRKVLNNPKDNPYQVDWSQAPEWADVHCWDEDGKGYWHGTEMRKAEWCNFRSLLSPFTLPDGLDWELSKTYRPR
jgi:hypothetical protein